MKLAGIGCVAILTASAAAATEFEAAAEAVMTDINRFWSAELGGFYRDAQWTTFTTPTQTPCGKADPSNAPFYCPGDARIYLGFGFFDAIAAQVPSPKLAQFVMSTVVAHEIGHHIQFLRGFGGSLAAARDALDEADRTDASFFLSRRFELQADCYSGNWAHHAFASMSKAQVAAAMKATDTLAHAFDSDQDHVTSHGDGDQRIHWFATGAETGEPGVCDTFATIKP